MYDSKVQNNKDLTHIFLFFIEICVGFILIIHMILDKKKSERVGISVYLSNLTTSQALQGSFT